MDQPPRQPKCWRVPYGPNSPAPLKSREDPTDHLAQAGLPLASQSFADTTALLTSDCGSFASLRLTKEPDSKQMLEISFTWLQESGNGKVYGWKEDVRLPYAPFHAFAEARENMDGTEWRQFSIPELVTRCYEFRSRKNLHEVALRPVLRRKLGKVLDRHLQWKGTEKIIVYDDGQPFSFFFQEYTLDGSGICGGIILHSAGDLQKAQYSIHT